MERRKISKSRSLLVMFAKAYHNCFSPEELMRWSFDRLVGLLHPTDRQLFITKEEGYHF